MQKQTITLTTDFGLTDSYVGQLKGIILSIAAETQIVDISHYIPAYDIMAGARILKEISACFPDRTVHLAVVDPTVGSERKRIIIEARLAGVGKFDAVEKTAFFVGPDNGLLSLAAPKDSRVGVWEIDSTRLGMEFKYGETFDGRNIFAPASAFLLKGRDLKEFAKPIDSIQELYCPPVVNKEGRVNGVIVNFDAYGNAATNISAEDILSGDVLVYIGDSSREGLLLKHRFDEFAPGTTGCIINSQGFLEIIANQASAKEKLGLEIGMSVVV